MDDLLRLGERYAALGLIAAATSCLERVSEHPDSAAAALRRLIELSLASGRAREARGYARRLSKIDRSPEARLLHGRTQLASGELAGARFSFTAVADAARAHPLDRARAMAGRADVAEAEGDRAGASANISGAAEVLFDWLGRDDTRPEEIDAEHSFIDELVRLAVAWKRSDVIEELIEGLESSGKVSPAAMMRGLWLAARQSHGDPDVGDAEIDAAFGTELEARPGSVAGRLRRCERLLRRRFRGSEAREQAIAELGELAQELEASGEATALLARVYWLQASAFEDDPASYEQAVQAYERGLALRPSLAAAAARLAEMHLARGRGDEALEALQRALRIDGEHAGAWVTAVRLAKGAPGADEEVTAQLLDTVEPGTAPAAAAAIRLVSAAATVTRDDVLAGMYARGHRLKNLLGIIGVRARGAHKAASAESERVAQRLGDLVTALSALYEEWGQYLRSMQTDAVIETVALAPLVREVVQAARDMGTAAVELDIAGAPADLTGDRVLLREALTNIVANAVQACGDSGAVHVWVGARASAGAPTVEIRVRDTGPGIPAAELGQVLSPGFTTKESGSGIGLAVSERVIAAHQGRIHIDSQMGVGTQVTVILPCELAALSSFSSL